MKTTKKKTVKRASRHGYWNEKDALPDRAYRAEVRTIQHLSRKQLAMVGNMIIQGNVPLLKSIRKSRTAPALKVMMACIALRVIEKGDHHAFDALLNRLVGKVPDKIDLEGTMFGAGPRIVVNLPSNGREVRAYETIEAEKESAEALSPALMAD